MLGPMEARSAVALLCVIAAACTYQQDSRMVEATIIAPGNFRAGSGVIQSVGVLANARPPHAMRKQAEGGPKPDPNLYRLFLQMDRGGFQTVDIDNNTFAAGQAVELTNDGRVLRVTGSEMQDLFRR